MLKNAVGASAYRPAVPLVAQYPPGGSYKQVAAIPILIFQEGLILPKAGMADCLDLSNITTFLSVSYKIKTDSISLGLV